MTMTSTPVTTQWLSDAEVFFAALSLAGAIDRAAFDAAHYHIIATVEAPPPRQLYPDWLPMSKRRQSQCTYPSWYKAYKDVFDTHVAVHKARNDLDDILKQAEKQIPGPNSRHGISKREFVLYRYELTNNSSAFRFGRLQYAYVDKRKEIEETFQLHQQALRGFHRLFEVPDDKHLQVLSFLSPNFRLESSMKQPANLNERFELRMQPMGWCLNPRIVASIDLLKQRYVWVDVVLDRFNDMLKNEHIDNRIKVRETYRFYGERRRHSNRRWSTALQTNSGDFVEPLEATNPIAVRVSRTRTQVSRTRTQSFEKRWDCPFRWGDDDDDDDDDDDKNSPCECDAQHVINPID
jgi:hypothetical protein